MSVKETRPLRDESREPFVDTQTIPGSRGSAEYNNKFNSLSMSGERAREVLGDPSTYHPDFSLNLTRADWDKKFGMRAATLEGLYQPEGMDPHSAMVNLYEAGAIRRGIARANKHTVSVSEAISEYPHIDQ
jgi:hypothetical protein